jgi:hypothetical protein
LVIGYPVQAIIDPEKLQTDEYLAAVSGALGPVQVAA